MNKINGRLSCLNDDWHTPNWIIKEAKNIMGKIDLDPDCVTLPTLKMELTKGKNIDYYYITNEINLNETIKIFKNQNLILGDTETYPLDLPKSSALDCHTSQIRLLQLNYPNNPYPYVIDCLKIGLKKVKKLIEVIKKKRILFFNAPFDLKIIKKNFDIWLEQAWCVQIMMQLIAGATGFKWHQDMGFSYKALCRDYLNVNLDKTEGSSDWKNPNLSSKQLEYAAIDVGNLKSNKNNKQALLHQAYKLFLKLLTQPFPLGYDMEFSLNLEQNSMLEITKMEYTGLPVNKTFINAFKIAAVEEFKKQEIKLAKILNLPVISFLDLSEDLPSINYKLDKKTKTLLNSPTKLIDYIQKSCRYYKEKIEDLNAKSIEIIILNIKKDRVKNANSLNIKSLINYDLKIFEELLEYKKFQKMLDKDWEQLINPITNCIHANYRCIGTSTGRMSSSGKIFGVKFNAQQIPRKKIVIDINETDLYEVYSIIM